MPDGAAEATRKTKPGIYTPVQPPRNILLLLLLLLRGLLRRVWYPELTTPAGSGAQLNRSAGLVWREVIGKGVSRRHRLCATADAATKCFDCFACKATEQMPRPNASIVRNSNMQSSVIATRSTAAARAVRLLPQVQLSTKQHLPRASANASQNASGRFAGSPRLSGATVRV